MARPEKEEAVKDIAGRFSESDAALLTEYRGLSVTDMAELRIALGEAEADYKVLKNTLARIAVREVGLEDLVGMLEGPTAIAFIKGDAAAAAKALDAAAKRFPVLQIKGGVLSGRIIDADQARELASLEPREVQLTKIAMMMNSPLQQTANVIGALLRDLGSMLAQVIEQKGPAEGSGSDPAPTEEPAAESAPQPGAEDPPVEEETVESPSVGPAPEEAPQEASEATNDESSDEGSKEDEEA
jgi:large subunit ribosomal protein L10